MAFNLSKRINWTPATYWPVANALSSIRFQTHKSKLFFDFAKMSFYNGDADLKQKLE